MWTYYYDANESLCIQNTTPQTSCIKNNDWHKAVYIPSRHAWMIDTSEKVVCNESFKIDYLYLVTGTMSSLFNRFLRADEADKLEYYSEMRKDAISELRGVFKSIPTAGGLIDIINQAFGEVRKDDNTMYTISAYNEAILAKREKIMDRFVVKKAIFNEPYTIVIWADGTKTIVKCAKGQAYDKYTGLVTCYLKRGFGGETIYPRIRKEIRKVLDDSIKKEKEK